MKKILLFILTFFIISCATRVGIEDYNRYAFKLLDQNLYKEAVYYLQKAKNEENLTKKEKVKIFNNLAICYEALGEKEKADEYYKKALKLEESRFVKENYEDFKENNN